MFPSDTGAIGHKWILTFWLLFYFAVCPSVRSFTSEFHLGTIVPCTRINVYDFHQKLIKKISEWRSFNIVLASSLLSQVYSAHKPILAQHSIFLSPENVRKSKTFWCFQKVKKWNIGIKWLNPVFLFLNLSM